MTIQQIKYVLALDIYRHFVKAAESCFVTQSTLTIQVKKLEEEIGCELFDRSVQPLVPTPMGEQFILKARKIDFALQDLKDTFNQEFNRIEGKFRLGIIPTLAPYLLPLFLGEFLEKHPKTILEIEELESETILSYLKLGRLDLGLLSTPTHEAGIREIPLFYEPFLLYSNLHNNILQSEDRIKVEQLEKDKIWLLAKGHCFRNQMMNFCNLSTETCSIQNLHLGGGSIETLKKMIKTTSGYTLIPELSVDEAVDKDYIKRLEEPEPAREISLVVQKNFTKRLLIKELKSCIVKNIPSHFQNVNKFQPVLWRT
ncbi:hydrogen peroxide-inducible genes activator [Elizabethkingia sp. JS20170427COW]|uniref:hydrogen peroxide-inducible genes activator n=1 Tax=Elizabethkingia sp. JS20170427COW TaxID=2583851 RepID=UPI0011108E6D|nr:hydrogen peroxide-inducible genes activator [Elizabethkingia sp. JS20170427COW]QCX53611.1 hydrogen peroxide-inducible genes activator [Elizabethkingia sp. JS20170427COW]